MLSARSVQTFVQGEFGLASARVSGIFAVGLGA
jgi:hypothetical protein